MAPESTARGARRPGPVPSLSLSRIAVAAVVIADRRGLDAVTMRSVASALDTTAPALYRYLGSRDELVAQMIDLVSAEVEHPPPSGDWVHDLVLVGEHQRSVFQAHPWLATAEASAPTFGPHVLDHLDWGLAALAPVDAPTGAKLEAIALVNGIASLFSAAQATPSPIVFSHLDPARHPHLAALLVTPPSAAASEDLFARVVTGILYGVLGAPASQAEDSGLRGR